MTITFKHPQKIESLKGQLLVATPMVDDSFMHSVILMLEHNEEGAMGLVINRPVPDIHYEDLYDQLKLDDAENARLAPVFFGGPVEVNRGFVMFSNDRKEAYEDTLDVGNVVVTTSLQVLKDIAMGNAPINHRIILGYAGWEAGQLEAEMEENSWLTVPATPELIFSADHHLSWEQAALSAGVDWTNMSTTVGHA